MTGLLLPLGISLLAWILMFFLVAQLATREEMLALIITSAVGFISTFVIFLYVAQALPRQAYADCVIEFQSVEACQHLRPDNSQ